MKSSRIPGFYQLSHPERIARVAEITGLERSAVERLQNTGNVDADAVDAMIENVVGTFNVPLGVATNLVIDGEEVLVPMATEESSVVAAVSNAARRCRDAGGITTSATAPLMIAQIQLLDIANPELARLKVLERSDDIQTICDETDPVLARHGGGLRSVEARVVNSRRGPMVVVHLLVDVRDAMGANAVNSMAEAVAPTLAEWTGGRSHLRILSNLADRRLVRAHATWPLAEIGGVEVREHMLDAYEFAEADPYRATTHNKGIMNGVTAVVLATGNDTRAVESGAHAYACRDDSYRSLTRWETDSEGNLCGSLEMPLPVGLIGGATRSHPTAQLCLEILGVDDAVRLSRIIAAVGLAQNFAALRALATTGIQKGHMALHAKNIAMMAGATGDELQRVADALVERGTVRVDVAEEILQQIRG